MNMLIKTNIEKWTVSVPFHKTLVSTVLTSAVAIPLFKRFKKSTIKKESIENQR